MHRLDLKVDLSLQEPLPRGKAFLVSQDPDAVTGAPGSPFYVIGLLGLYVAGVCTETFDSHGLFVIVTPGTLFPVGNPRLDAIKPLLMVSDIVTEDGKERVIDQFLMAPSECIPDVSFELCLAFPLDAVMDKLTLPVGVPVFMHPNVTQQIREHGYLKQAIDVSEALGVQPLETFIRDTRTQFSKGGLLVDLARVNKGLV